MDRREAIKATTLILGYSVSTVAIGGVLHGCKMDRTADGVTWSPRFFTPEEAGLIPEVTETILPATETPGAKDVKAYEFIDLLLADCYPPERQQAFRDGLAAIENESQVVYGKTFLKCSKDERHSLLTDIEASQAEQRHEETEEEVSPGAFFPMLKELTLLGYFTSEVIGEDYLNYDPVPGSYNGCIPLSDVGNAWSLS